MNARRTPYLLVLIAACTLVVSGCSDDGDGTDNNGGDAGGDAMGDAGGDAGGDTGSDADSGGDPVISFECPGFEIAEGLNSGISISGVQRTFDVAFPANTNQEMGVVFSWHGYGDNVDNFKNFFSAATDAYADFPLIVVTPEDTDMFPIGNAQGLDWDIFQTRDGVSNRDADLFEAVLGCLNQDYDIDPTHVHAIGFSAGAIMTNLLHARYSDLVASVISISGAWFNDQDTADNVNTMGFATLNWDPLTQSSSGAILMTHGGDTDVFGVGGQQIIDFELSAGYAVPHLVGAGRTVIDCSHNNGHQPHPGLNLNHYLDFLQDNPAGATSPYLGGNLPSSFPSSCGVE